VHGSSPRSARTRTIPSDNSRTRAALDVVIVSDSLQLGACSIHQSSPKLERRAFCGYRNQRACREEEFSCERADASLFAGGTLDQPVVQLAGETDCDLRRVLAVNEWWPSSSALALPSFDSRPTLQRHRLGIHWNAAKLRPSGACRRTAAKLDRGSTRGETCAGVVVLPAQDRVSAADQPPRPMARNRQIFVALSEGMSSALIAV
jgi:hypothetical protein